MFRKDVGRTPGHHDEIGVCRVDGSGRPVLATAAQIRLVGVDSAAGAITVARGHVGTTPLAFAVGSYLALRSGSGPWGGSSQRVWDVNLSTTCRRDSSARTYADLVLENNQFNVSVQCVVVER